MTPSTGSASLSVYLVKGHRPLLRDRVVDDLVAELLGGDDRSLALEEFTIPGRAACRRRCADAAGGAEAREEVVGGGAERGGQPAVHDRAARRS